MALCVADAGGRSSSCRDGKAAATLKLISIFVIFFTSVVGISLPVFLARLFQGKPAYDKAVLIIKCFAAGVILSTSLVHVLPDAFDALSDCQVASRHPWKDFPFSGLITLIGALTALFVDLTATSHVENHGHGHGHGEITEKKRKKSEYTPIGLSEELGKKMEEGGAAAVESKCLSSSGDGDLSTEAEAEELVKLKQRLVSQVLEIGIIFHSVIIGVTLGMSQNKCTIRPLVAALSFHQIFEGMGLGGCIAQVLFLILFFLFNFANLFVLDRKTWLLLPFMLIN